MGCCCCSRRAGDKPFRADQVVPSSPSSDPPHGKSAEVDSGAVATLPTDRPTAASSTALPAEEEDDDDDEAGADDEQESSASSASCPGESQEQMWMRQARRQQKQERRRKRAKRKAKADARAAAASGDTTQAVDAPRSLDVCYQIDDRLGRGTYSTVSRCTNLKSQERCALKSIDRRKATSANQLQEEVEVMRLLHKDLHPNIVKLYDVFEDNKCVHVVMELLAGGELYETMAANLGKGFSDSVSSNLTRQIASAVSFMHSHCVAHRDLKPENFMLVEVGSMDNAALKVIDFGFARRFQSGQLMRTMACTPQYVAPEILCGEYTEACDLWSIGVVIYVILCGSQPFTGGSETQLFTTIKNGVYNFDKPTWDTVSQAAKALVRELLVTDPAQRPTAGQVLKHAWLDSNIG